MQSGKKKFAQGHAEKKKITNRVCPRKKKFVQGAPAGKKIMISQFKPKRKKKEY